MLLPTTYTLVMNIDGEAFSPEGVFTSIDELAKDLWNEYGWTPENDTFVEVIRIDRDVVTGKLETSTDVTTQAKLLAATGYYDQKCDWTVKAEAESAEWHIAQFKVAA